VMSSPTALLNYQCVMIFVIKGYFPSNAAVRDVHAIILTSVVRTHLDKVIGDHIADSP
jgi:hypothetical protein